MTSSGQQTWLKITVIASIYYVRNMCDFVVSTMPDGSLAPLCDIISADNVILLFGPCT